MSDKKAEHATEDSRWDTFTLISVLRAHFSAVFAKTGTSDFKAKALLKTLLQVFERRNSRAHNRTPTEAESLDALSKIEHVLTDCNIMDVAATIHKLRADAQDRVEKARTADEAAAAAADRGEAQPAIPTLHLPMDVHEHEALVLYRAMTAFEAAFAVAVKEPAGRPAGGWFYQGGNNATITLGNRPGSAIHTVGRKQRISAAASSLQLIASARHWLFHNTGATIDVSKILRAMGRLLHQFEGIADSTATIGRSLSHTHAHKPL